MNPLINVPSLALKERKNNIRFHTEIRDNHYSNTSRKSEVKITNFGTQRNHKKILEKSNISKKTFTSFKSFSKKNVGFLSNACSPNYTTRVNIVKEEITESMIKKEANKNTNITENLEKIFETCENITSNLYNYSNVETEIKYLNQKVKKLKSTSAEFFCFSISALILFEYSNLSLAIFYFDKALKALSTKPLYSFDCITELLIYKYTSKVFLQIKKLKEAREMAYMYLRKSWMYLNLDEEMNAYDLLGQIELEEGNIEMSRYFHWRMCHGVREQKEIILMSNLELNKREKIKIELAVYEDIMIFVKSEEQIVSILSNRFRAEAETECEGFTKKNRQFLFYTHRSSNRILKNHRVLERRLIHEKESNELHFIRPKEIKKLKSLMTEFSDFILNLKKQWEISILRRSIDFEIQDENF